MRTSTSTRSRSRSYPLVQRLEDRRLLSGSWATVDTDPTSYGLWGMAADKFGNVYAIGSDAADDYNDVLREETNGVWSTIVNMPGDFDSVATDPSGNVFIVGQNQVWEHAAGQPGVSPIVTGAFSTLNAVTTDAAGDVFIAGGRAVTTTVKGKTTTTSYGTVTRLVPRPDGTFDVSTATVGTANYASSVSVIPSGPAAGIYAIGRSGATNNETWLVFKSTDGGTNWRQVEQFRYSTTAGSTPNAIVGDAAGNVYVAGECFVSVLTGYSKGKPVYSTRGHWITRKSATGESGTWATVDDQLDADPIAMGTDLAGNVYAVGYGSGNSQTTHAIIRTNAGGTWGTSDDYVGPAGTKYCYNAFAVDSNGTLFAGGDDMMSAAGPTFVRSMAGPPPAASTQTAAAPSPQLSSSPTNSSLFSTTTISSTSQTDSNRLVDELLAA